MKSIDIGFGMFDIPAILKAEQTDLRRHVNDGEEIDGDPNCLHGDCMRGPADCGSCEDRTSKRYSRRVRKSCAGPEVGAKMDKIRVEWFVKNKAAQRVTGLYVLGS